MAIDYNIWLTFAIHLFYRFLRFLCHFVQSEIIWRYNNVYDHLTNITSDRPDDSASALETCQLLTILYRKKLVEADMTGATDFVWWHDSFAKPKNLLAADPHWSLYTLDKDFAYFLRMPKPWPFYHAREAPFVFMRQFKDGKMLARMPLKAFCRFAEKSLDDPKGPVVYYTNAARSGTTLLTRVMQVSEEKIVCFGEPDAFTALAILQERGFINHTLTLDLLKAMFKYYCKHQLNGQTYFMKVQSNTTRIVPFIKQAMPRVKHMFTYRRNTRRVLSSLEKILRGGTAGDVIVTLWNLYPNLAAQFVNFGGFEYEMFKRFGMKDCLDMAIICHVAPFYYYYRCRDLFDIPVIYYEDLIAEKEKTLKSVFELCQLPYDQLIGEALKEFGNDSQAGTVLSQNNMKCVPDTDLDEDKIKEMHDMCDQLKIPRIEA